MGNVPCLILQALRQLLPVLSVGDKNAEEKREIGSEGFGEFGCVSHPGVLSNTSVPFDLYVKVGLCFHEYILPFFFRFE